MQFVFCCWLVCFYLVRGTSSRWSSVTADDLLSTDGVTNVVTKASVLLVGEQLKSEGGALPPPDGLEWQARQEQGLPPGPRPWAAGPWYSDGGLKAHSSSGRG